MATGYEMFEALNSADMRADPYPLYSQFRELGEVAELADGFLVATSYEAVDAVLRDNAFGPEEKSAVPIPGHRSLLNSNPPDHTRMRRLMSGAFTPRRVHGLHDAVARMAGELIDAMRDKGTSGDLIADFAYRLPVNVICELLGVPEKDRDWFRPVAHDFTVAMEAFTTELEYTMAVDAANLIRAYFAHLVQARRGTRQDDLISDLAAAPDLTEDELLSNLALLLIAGFETTTNLIGNGVMAWLRDPREVDNPAAFVEEVLRYDSPVQLTSRVALEPTVLSGRQIGTGTYVIAMIGSANRDPKRFTDPDRFDPNRANNTPLSFGAGAHFCLGAALARMEGRIAFPLLWQRFPGLRLDGEPVRRNRLVLRGFESLPVAWN